MEQAIKIAIENGWGINRYGNKFVKLLTTNEFHTSFEINQTMADFDDKTGEQIEVPVRDSLHTDKILLDPLFWKALGKGLGWEKLDIVTNSAEYREWNGQWHRFIDHLVEGKDIDSFFAGLINPSELK